MNKEQFEPEMDPITQRWANRLDLPPDDAYVIGTAEIERIREELTQRLQNFEQQLQEKNNQWIQNLNQNNRTLTQALKLVESQQQNQDSMTGNFSSLTETNKSLTSTCDKLTQTLSQFSNELTGFKTKIQESKKQMLDFKNNTAESNTNSLTLIADLNQSLNKLRIETANNLKSIQNKIESQGTSSNDRQARADLISLISIWVACSTAIGAVIGWGFSQKSFDYGYSTAQEYLTGKFGGVTNHRYWSELRRQNLNQINACKEQGNSECFVELP